ncbi:MAG: phosphate/phosphite/phosphonate ABC transporter substrate-binding protein [Elainellaceae cyanobacterium]
MFFSLIYKAKPTLLALGILLLIPSLSACSRVNQTGASSQATPTDAVQVGVLVALESTEEIRNRYQPLLDEVGKMIDRPVVLVPVTQESQFLMAKTGKADFILTNSLASAQLRQLHNAEILATVSRPNTNTEFGGVIIVGSNSPIQTIEDLRNRKGACVSLQTAAAGCLFQIYHLQQNGLNPYRDLIIEEITSQTEIVAKVASGEVDFGFVRTGQMEKMIQQEAISADAVRILEPIQDGYPFPRTTELYPEWALSAVQDTPGDLVSKVQQAILNLPEGSAALTSAEIEKFVPAEDYTKINALVEALEL